MNKLRVPTVAEMIANNERPDILFWVGCSGSFDDRAKKISKAIVKILMKVAERIEGCFVKLERIVQICEGWREISCIEAFLERSIRAVSG